jgi:hypothetical protein
VVLYRYMSTQFFMEYINQHLKRERMIYIYRVSQNLCHKLFLGIPHPQLSKEVPINMGPKVSRFQDIDLCSYADTLLSIT